MTRIQQVLFELESDYLGHPYCVTGHALFNAVAPRVDARTRRSLHVSTGVFVPGEYGSYPETHSQSGYGGKLGTSLPPVESYADLFVFRDSAQRWLLDSRPRDAHNAHPVQRHGREERLAFASECWFGRPPETRNRRRSVQWFVHCYLHADSDDVIPLSKDVLDGLQVGGARNYGFGELSLADSQVVDLDALKYAFTDSDSDAYVLELVSPYVLQSEFPGADDQSVPWWWDVTVESPTGVSSTGDELRRRDERLVDGADVYSLRTVDHGQVVGYGGHDPVTTAMNGVTRVGTHSRYGFGEFRVRPLEADRVAERAEATVSGGEA